MDLSAINPILLLASLMVAATPILLAAIGELVVERAGVLNLGVEGMMITGAVCGFVIAVATGSPWLGFVGAAVGGALLSLLFGVLTQFLLSNQVATGLALTLFGLDMPYRLFDNDEHDKRKTEVLDSYLAGLDRICAEPFMDCVAHDREGNPCIEIKSPQDLEREVGLDLGNIFHNSLSWFFTDEEQEVGRWGVETHHPRIYRAGSSATRGGAVSGIPGRCAAKSILNT